MHVGSQGVVHARLGHALCTTNIEVSVGLDVQASDSAAREQLEKVVEVLETERCVTFDDCIAWARRNFQVPQPNLSIVHPSIA